MSIIKKIIKDTFESVKEGAKDTLKDSAKQLAKTISPTEMLKQATGGQKGSSEFTEYLKKLGPNLSAEEAAKRAAELKSTEQTDLEKTRKVIQSAIPAHLRPIPKPSELRPYEQYWKDLEQNKQKALNAQKSQAGGTSVQGKKKLRLGQTKQPKSTPGFEAKVNVKQGW
ncbi:hypothetical protein MUP32_00115 [Candidatus Microgenomates bacterium]|nr:hypothetical protein [Candidatus Microgenomates bacterium]